MSTMRNIIAELSPVLLDLDDINSTNSFLEKRLMCALNRIDDLKKKPQKNREDQITIDKEIAVVRAIIDGITENIRFHANEMLERANLTDLHKNIIKRLESEQIVPISAKELDLLKESVLTSWNVGDELRSPELLPIGTNMIFLKTESGEIISSHWFIDPTTKDVKKCVLLNPEEKQ